LRGLGLSMLNLSVGGEKKDLKKGRTWMSLFYSVWGEKSQTRKRGGKKRCWRRILFLRRLRRLSPAVGGRRRGEKSRKKRKKGEKKKGGGERAPSFKLIGPIARHEEKTSRKKKHVSVFGRRSASDGKESREKRKLHAPYPSRAVFAATRRREEKKEKKKKKRGKKEGGAAIALNSSRRLR